MKMNIWIIIILLLLLLLLLLLFINFNISKTNKKQNQVEGFEREPIIKNNINNILNCKNYECIINKENICKKACDEEYIKNSISSSQSKSKKQRCIQLCINSGNQIRESMRYQEAIFGRVPS